MQKRQALRGDQWAKIKEPFAGENDRVVTAKDKGLLIDAVMWTDKAGL